MRLIIRRQWHRDGYGIWLVQDDGQGYRVGKPTEILFEDVPGRGAFALPEPTFELRGREMEMLISSVKEEMVGQGLESPAIANAAELKATKYHLEDMRKLALSERKDDRTPHAAGR